MKKSKKNKLPLAKDSLGRELVELSVFEDASLLSPFSPLKKQIISRDVADVIESQLKVSKPKTPLHIKINCKPLPDTTKQKYALAIKNYYNNEIVDLNRTISHHIISSIILAVISIVVLVLQFTLIVNLNSNILSEIFYIIAWVFMWEAVDIFFLQRQMLSIKKARYKKIVEAKISFVEEDTQKV